MPDSIERFTFEPVDTRFIIGEPPTTDANYVCYCPKCRTVLDEDCEGYGFAFGGGVGWYQFCDEDACDWFYKWLDVELVNESGQRRQA